MRQPTTFFYTTSNGILVRPPRTEIRLLIITGYIDLVHTDLLKRPHDILIDNFVDRISALAEALPDVRIDILDYCFNTAFDGVKYPMDQETSMEFKRLWGTQSWRAFRNDVQFLLQAYRNERMGWYQMDWQDVIWDNGIVGRRGYDRASEERRRMRAEWEEGRR